MVAAIGPDKSSLDNFVFKSSPSGVLSLQAFSFGTVGVRSYSCLCWIMLVLPLYLSREQSVHVCLDF
ncbi:hypothetical protein L3X38_027044 [Prunus dulcis]|uniref:Uncharacterized protein n=1 Tax=Prunus dulcis TaxID=3755 RepID=A0AAD4VMA8_PRUDU|nr:hypothetical protein L3X38_027044 [Prunus dulcis]